MLWYEVIWLDMNKTKEVAHSHLVKTRRVTIGLFFRRMTHIRLSKLTELTHAKAMQPTSSQAHRKLPSWWFQPIWKISVKLGIFPKFRGENKKYVSCHHLVTISFTKTQIRFLTSFASEKNMWDNSRVSSGENSCFIQKKRSNNWQVVKKIWEFHELVFFRCCLHSSLGFNGETITNTESIESLQGFSLVKETLHLHKIRATLGGNAKCTKEKNTGHWVRKGKLYPKTSRSQKVL